MTCSKTYVYILYILSSHARTRTRTHETHHLLVNRRIAKNITENENRDILLVDFMSRVTTTLRVHNLNGVPVYKIISKGENSNVIAENSVTRSIPKGFTLCLVHRNSSDAQRVYVYAHTHPQQKYKTSLEHNNEGER